MRSFRVSGTIGCAGPILSLCLLVSGCSSLSGGSQLHSSAKGSIQLQEVADWSFEASHPVLIDHPTMLKVIKGLSIEDSTVSSNKMPASGSKPMRAFSDEEAEFLAPLLAHGLSQAKPEQIIGFMVPSSAGSGAEPTVGTLYVQRGAIHLTINSSRGKKGLTFFPATAARVEKARTPGAVSMAIDYQALAKNTMPGAASITIVSKKSAIQPIPPTPMAQAAEPPHASAGGFTAPSEPTSGSQDLSSDEILSKKLDELRQVRESNAIKESEILMLRKEAEWMKRELRERSAELKALRANQVSSQPAAKKKPAEARRMAN